MTIRKEPPVSQLAVPVANAKYLCHGHLYTYPYWVKRQWATDFSVSGTFHNVAYRSWTTLHAKEGHICIDPVGMLSPNRTWSLEVWALIAGKFWSLVTATDVVQRYQEGILTKATLGSAALTMHVTTLSPSDKKMPAAGQLRLTVSSDSEVSLFLAVRPYNVEGISPISHITYHTAGAFIVNRQLGLVVDTPPHNVLCLPYSEGDPAARIGQWEQIFSARCPVGVASGYAEYRLSPGTHQVMAWLPLVPTLTGIEILPSMAQQQLRTSIEAYQKQTVTDTIKAGVVFTLSPQMTLYSAPHLSHLRDNPPDEEDPWMWLGNFGELYWIFEPKYRKNAQEKYCQRLSSWFRQAPSLFRGAILMLGLDHCEGALVPTAIVTKACQMAMKLPLPKYPISTTEDLPIDHAFGKGPYWLVYFFALRILNATSHDPQSAQTKIWKAHALTLETALSTALADWADRYGEQTLPLSMTRYEELGIVYALLCVFPFGVLTAEDTRITAVRNTLEVFRNKALLLGRGAPAGYPMIENLLDIAVRVLCGEHESAWASLDVLSKYISPTGSIARASHPLTRMGSDGEGHHLPSSGLWLAVLRQLFIQDHGPVCRLCPAVPPEEWRHAWLFPNMPTRFGPVFLQHQPGETHTITVQNLAGKAIPFSISLPPQAQIQTGDTHFVLESQSVTQVVFVFS